MLTLTVCTVCASNHNNQIKSDELNVNPAWNETSNGPFMYLNVLKLTCSHEFALRCSIVQLFMFV